MKKQLGLECSTGVGLTRSEQRVLSVFRQFLMTPGQMLCFGAQELEAYDATLSEMSRKGLVMAERARGAYSLTKLGFNRMRQGH